MAEICRRNEFSVREKLGVGVCIRAKSAAWRTNLSISTLEISPRQQYAILQYLNIPGLYIN